MVSLLPLVSPYMVLRSEHEGLKGFHNVCRHHGTQLLASDGLSSMSGHNAEGVLKEKCIKCPYHGWTYNLEGKLTKATRMKGSEKFSATNYGLHPIPLQTEGPFVFLQFNQPKRVGDAPVRPEDQVAAHPLPQLPEDFAGMVHVLQRTYEVECNWKVYVVSQKANTGTCGSNCDVLIL
jgi:choline monooxygenase